VGLGGGVQRTPSGNVGQGSKSRTRRSEDVRRKQQRGVAGSGSTARRPSAKTNRRSMEFVFDSEGTNPQQVLSLCIELQPPSHLRTIAQAAVEPTPTAMATPKGNIKEPPSTERKNHTRSLASALSAFDMRTLSPGTLLPAFLSVPSSPLLVSMLAPPEHCSLRLCLCFLFLVLYTDWVTFCACVTEQARHGRCGPFAGKAERVVGKVDGGWCGWGPWAW